MDNPKCSRCHRRNDCALLDLAKLTLPWVVEATEGEGTEWERAHAVKRALRGCGTSPGYVEDWRLVGAMEQGDVDAIVRDVVAGRAATLAVLSRACRHYVGPVEACCCCAAA